MAALTNYLADLLVDAAFRATAYTGPTTPYLALYTTNPDNTGAGTEVTGGSYTRKAIAFSDGDLPGEVKNTSQIDFTSMPAVTVVGCAILTANTGGSMMAYVVLPDPRVVAAGETLTVAAGTLVIGLT